MSDQNLQATLLGKIAAYTEILVKDPKSTIFVSLAETYRKMGMLEDSRQIINKGIELHPGFSPAYIVLARVFCQLENYEASVSAFDQALELDNESLAAYVGLARVKILLGAEDDARLLLLQARKLSPADPVINKLLLSLPQDHDSDSMEQSAEDLENNSAPLFSATLAELYLKQGLTGEALKVYLQLSADAPDDLSLRRKIKELEGEPKLEDDALSEADEAVSDAATEDVQASDEMVDTITSQRVTELDSCVAQDAERTEISPEEAVLNTLQRWLTGIEQRRGHV